MAVHQGKPKFVDDAVQLALEYETFQNGRKKGSTENILGLEYNKCHKICPPMSWMIFSHQEFVRFPKIIGIPKAENPKSKLIIKNNQNKNTGECHYFGIKGHYTQRNELRRV